MAASASVFLLIPVNSSFTSSALNIWQCPQRVKYDKVIDMVTATFYQSCCSHRGSPEQSTTSSHCCTNMKPHSLPKLGTISILHPWFFVVVLRPAQYSTVYFLNDVGGLRQKDRTWYPQDFSFSPPLKKLLWTLYITDSLAQKIRCFLRSTTLSTQCALPCPGLWYSHSISRAISCGRLDSLHSSLLSSSNYLDADIPMLSMLSPGRQRLFSSIKIFNYWAMTCSVSINYEYPLNNPSFLRPVLAWLLCFSLITICTLPVAPFPFRRLLMCFQFYPTV